MLASYLLALSFLTFALAAPQTPDADWSVHIPLVKRKPLSVKDLPRAVAALKAKYRITSPSVPSKRAGNTAAIPIVDEQNDSSYSGEVTIGTPPQTFQAILDTGSADLWLITNTCKSSQCVNIPSYDPSKSSSLQLSSSSLQIDYGSGSVVGTPAIDTVSFGGFTIPRQTWLAASTVQDQLLAPGVSGIMGLGFQPISSLRVPPVWEAAYNANLLAQPLFGVFLDRVTSSFQAQTTAGGTLTMGGTNTSLYVGDIEYIEMPSGQTPSYWLQQISTITVLGKTLQLSSSEGLAAIDTGTTLIGGPSDLVAQFWSNVPGAQSAGSQYPGMYAFPCSTTLSVSISFGGKTWPINSVDMNIGPPTSNSNMCIGSIFSTEGTVGPDVPTWIVGDTFLKNVYSVYRASPPAVGFAQLPNGPAPSGSGSGSGSGSPGASSAASLSGTRLSSLLVTVILLATHTLMYIW